MTLYHLQAHLSRTEESDDLADLAKVTATAKCLAGSGYEVYVYDDQGNPHGVPCVSDLREIASYWPNGTVILMRGQLER